MAVIIRNLAPDCAHYYFVDNCLISEVAFLATLSCLSITLTRAIELFPHTYIIWKGYEMKNTTLINQKSFGMPLAATENGYVETAPGHAACSTRARQIMESVICDTIDWIDAHLDGNLQAARLAERAGYTRWHFQRKFKEITGCALSDYVRYRRIEKVAQAIVSTDDYIIKIAFEYGYTSQQALSRIIRDHYGMSPTEMRRLAIKRRGAICQPE